MNSPIEEFFKNLKRIEEAHEDIVNSMTIRILYHLICTKLILNKHDVGIPSEFATFDSTAEFKLNRILRKLFAQSIDGRISSRFSLVHKLMRTSKMKMFSKDKLVPFKTLKQLKHYEEHEDLALAA